MEKKAFNKTGFLHLLIVYFVWGSTYLAIRIGVRAGSGFPPFTFGALRVLVAGIGLMLWAAVRRKKLRISGGDLVTLIGSGFLLWIGGNGLVMWAEQQVDSAVAALIVASVPIWVSGMESVLDRRFPSFTVIRSLLVGFLGILVLSVPVLSSGIRANVISILALFLASLSWGSGLLLQSRRPVSVSRGVSSAYQQIFGGLFFGVLVLVTGEPPPNPTPQAWAAWGYLVVFGSMIAFTSFVSALQLLPTRLVITYAYINPVIAVLLGWVILDEPITIWTVGGAALVILGVYGVFQEDQKKIGQEKSPG